MNASRFGLSVLAALTGVLGVHAEDRRGVLVKELLKDAASLPAYHALVVGISRYDHWQSLRQTEPDARELAALLQRKYGFSQVRLLPEQQGGKVTRVALLAELRRFVDQLTEQDALLIYYAGHGHYDDKLDVGYWVTSEARETIDGQPAEADWVWNNALIQYLQAMKARHVLVISDACFSGALFRGGATEISRRENVWYQQALSHPSRWGISSGDLETVPDKSVFTTKLLQLLRYPTQSVFSGSDIAAWLKKEVAADSGRQPRFGPLKDPRGMATGEFVFLVHSPGGHPVTLEFRLGRSEPVDGLIVHSVPESSQKVFLESRAALANEDVAGAVARETDMGHEVELTFTRAGADKLARLTRENIGHPIAILVDGRVLAAPIIRTEIPGGKAVISGRFTATEARRLAEAISPPQGNEAAPVEP
jgi:hypothetical protein